MSNEMPQKIELELPAGPARRLDKALFDIVPEGMGLSRSRLTTLVKQGCVVDEQGHARTDPAQKVKAGSFVLQIPPSEELETKPEAIALDIVYEDDDLIVVNKPAGMVVHPAPGAPSGTLVNALLHHCGTSLSGVGGVRRPGIVHRIDKDTSGLLVVAKNDTSHQGLAVQFAAHSIERRYDAVVWGVPSASDPRLAGLPRVHFEPGNIIRIEANIARHPHDRKRMSVTKNGGRRAVTRLHLERPFGRIAAQVSCRLETGRTHQIRVHLTHIGHPLIGDPVYGRARSVPNSAPDELKAQITAFGRQALHAAVLGFRHPLTGEDVVFERQMPADMEALCASLSRV